MIWIQLTLIWMNRILCFGFFLLSPLFENKKTETVIDDKKYQ